MSEEPNEENVLKFTPKKKDPSKLPPVESSVEAVDFAKESELRDLSNRPHRSASVICTACNHEWVTIAPMEVWEPFPCPECKLDRGLAKSTAVFPSDYEEMACPTCDFSGFVVICSPRGSKFLCCAKCATMTPLENALYGEPEDESPTG